MCSFRKASACRVRPPGKYFCMKPKIKTWPTGVSGAMRMTAKGMKVSRSRAVRRRACTSRGLSVWPAGSGRAVSRPAAGPPGRVPGWPCLQHSGWLSKAALPCWASPAHCQQQRNLSPWGRRRLDSLGAAHGSATVVLYNLWTSSPVGGTESLTLTNCHPSPMVTPRTR